MSYLPQVGDRVQVKGQPEQHTFTIEKVHADSQQVEVHPDGLALVAGQGPRPEDRIERVSWNDLIPFEEQAPANR